MSTQQSTELADILRHAISHEKFRASKSQWKIINAILNCRTAALGGHLYQCTECGHGEPRYNSCRNRHCPKCQGADIAKWLQARSSDLLPVPYFHTVFTVPHQFNIVFLQNKKIMFNLLFKAINETLKTATKSRHGGTMGFFGVLHTWGQQMEFHPHVHCVIPGIIIKANGEIIRTEKNYFLPDRLLNKLFRAIFLKYLERAYSKGELTFHGEAVHLHQQKEFQKLKNSAVATDWIVYSKKPFSSPCVVLKYLSRYTHRVAISNSRIKSLKDGVVTFCYKDYRNKAKKKTKCFKAAEFTRRFLLHSLPLRFVRIRHFGFMANRHRKKSIRRINEAFDTTPTVLQEEILQTNCPKCNSGKLVKLCKLDDISLPHKAPNAIIPHRAQSPPTI